MCKFRIDELQYKFPKHQNFYRYRRYQWAKSKILGQDFTGNTTL